MGATTDCQSGTDAAGEVGGEDDVVAGPGTVARLGGSQQIGIIDGPDVAAEGLPQVLLDRLADEPGRAGALAQARPWVDRARDADADAVDARRPASQPVRPSSR